ncbi:hypothetical protein P5E51_16020, partial [Clostridium perfringens]|nr:hypothetical protein [Clostridium perfringens]
MDSKQLMPSNSGANRALASCFFSGRELCAAFSSCPLGAFTCCCFPPPLLQDRRVEHPPAAMSAGDELRMEKARILSMTITPSYGSSKLSLSFLVLYAT